MDRFFSALFHENWTALTHPLSWPAYAQGVELDSFRSLRVTAVEQAERGYIDWSDGMATASW